MANIIVLQHSTVGTPGRLGRTLRDHGFHLDIRRVDLPESEGGQAVPSDLDNVAGVIALGGPQSANDSDPWIRDEQKFLRKAHDAGLPIVGICFGSQTLAKALGGTVEAMKQPEVGFEEVHLTVPAQTETITAGIPWTHRPFSVHGEMVGDLPEGAMLLGGSAACKVQAYRVGQRTLGFQFHFEADRALIGRLLDDDPAIIERAGLMREDLDKQIDEYEPRFATIADRLCVNIASFCFAYTELLGV